jgi:hypothetical protein
MPMGCTAQLNLDKPFFHIGLTTKSRHPEATSPPALGQCMHFDGAAHRMRARLRGALFARRTAALHLGLHFPVYCIQLQVLERTS